MSAEPEPKRRRGAEEDALRLREGVRRGQAPELPLERIDLCLTMQEDQARGSFLVVQDLLPLEFCDYVLPELLARHRPRALSSGKGAGGASYTETNAWRLDTLISTYCWTSPETFVHQCAAL
jgi:hypothetical protein